MVLKIALWAFLIGSLVLGYFGMQAAGVTTTLIGIGVLFALVFLIYFLFQIGFEAFLVFLKFFGIALLVGVIILLTIRGCNMVISKGRQGAQALSQKTTQVTESIKESAEKKGVSNNTSSFISGVKSFFSSKKDQAVLPPPSSIAKERATIEVQPVEISGYVSNVYSGNVFKLANIYVKLYGVDVPALRQTCMNKRSEDYLCGKTSKQRLEKLLKNQKITCQIVSRYTVDKVVATCALKGYDVGATMVAVGWALADRRVTDAYIPYENEAHTQKLGLWAGKFMAPWTYRQQTPQSAVSGSKKGFFGSFFE